MAAAPLNLLTIADLAALPRPEWLIDGMVPAGVLTTLYGPSSVAKTFLELDWSLCTAAGVPWYGREVKQGPVVYIVGEGVTGIYQRVQAWQHSRHQKAPADLHFVAGAVNFLNDTEVEALKAAIDQLSRPPILIVVDTLARCMTGGDENSARDVGQVIANLDDLARPYAAAKGIVHHTGRSGEDERGSTALRGASDAMISLKPDGASIKLACEKQKDAAQFDPWTLHLEPVGESCVLRLGTNSGVLAPAERQVLETVSAAFGTNWTASTKIKESTSVPKSTYYRTLSTLVELGYLEPETTGRNPRYRLTEQGQAQLVPTSPTESHETGPVSPTVTASLRSGTGTGPETHNDNHSRKPRDLDADKHTVRVDAKVSRESWSGDDELGAAILETFPGSVLIEDQDVVAVPS